MIRRISGMRIVGTMLIQLSLLLAIRLERDRTSMANPILLRGHGHTLIRCTLTPSSPNLSLHRWVLPARQGSRNRKYALHDINNIHRLRQRLNAHRPPLVPAVAQGNSSSTVLVEVFARTVDVEEGEGEDHHLNRDDEAGDADGEVLECVVGGGL